jgi:hypothetical protein
MHLKRVDSHPVDYIDDIVLGTEEQKEKDDVVEFDESSGYIHPVGLWCVI